MCTFWKLLQSSWENYLIGNRSTWLRAYLTHLLQEYSRPLPRHLRQWYTGTWKNHNLWHPVRDYRYTTFVKQIFVVSVVDPEWFICGSDPVDYISYKFLKQEKFSRNPKNFAVFASKSNKLPTKLKRKCTIGIPLMKFFLFMLLRQEVCRSGSISTKCKAKLYFVRKYQCTFQNIENYDKYDDDEIGKTM